MEEIQQLEEPFHHLLTATLSLIDELKDNRGENREVMEEYKKALESMDSHLLYHLRILTYNEKFYKKKAFEKHLAPLRTLDTEQYDTEVGERTKHYVDKLNGLEAVGKGVSEMKGELENFMKDLDYLLLPENE